MQRNDTVLALVAFAVPLAVYLLSISKGVSDGSNIVAFQYSIWFNHSFNIQSNIYSLINTKDTIFYAGKYYSAFSPGFGIISLPFAGLGFLLDGKLLGDAVTMDKIFLALLGATSSLVTYKICRLYAKPNDALAGSFALAFGTTAWPFTTVIFDHVATMTFLAIAVYLILKTTRKVICEPRQAFLYFPAIGLALGAASFIDYIATLSIFPVIIYMSRAILNEKKFKKYVSQLALLVICFALGPLANLAYNESIFGNPLTFPEQFWGKTTSLVQRFSLSSLPLHLLFNLVSPYRGLLLLSPVLVFGFLGIYRWLKSRESVGDIVLLISLTLIIMIPYSSWDRWIGGYSFGPRFLIPILPFIVIPLTYFLSSSKSKKWYFLFFVLFLLSSLMQGAGALTNATPPNLNNILVFQPLNSILKLSHGFVDTWWSNGRDINRLIGGLIFLLIWIPFGYFTVVSTKYARVQTS